MPLTGEWPEATGEPPAEGEIVCRERLGGLLKHYARRAARPMSGNKRFSGCLDSGAEKTISRGGGAGSVLAILLWCYYAVTALFLGAEYIQELRARLRQTDQHWHPHAAETQLPTHG